MRAYRPKFGINEKLRQATWREAGVIIWVQLLQGRINYLVGPTHSTTPGPHWKAGR